MAEKKSKNKNSSKNKTPKRGKYYEPGFFNDYGGCGIIITNDPNTSQKKGN